MRPIRISPDRSVALNIAVGIAEKLRAKYALYEIYRLPVSVQKNMNYRRTKGCQSLQSSPAPASAKVVGLNSDLVPS